MKRSCSYCGRIHDGHCPKKPKRQYKVTDIDKFRSTEAWNIKRGQINGRDHYMCQICIRNLFDTHKQHNYENIEVHHITPIADDYDKRLDDGNLISICARHHKMAESGQITKKQLIDIVSEQERERR